MPDMTQHEIVASFLSLHDFLTNEKESTLSGFMHYSCLLLLGIILSFFCSSATARLNENSGKCFERYGKVIGERHGLGDWVTYIFFRDNWRVTVTFFNDKAQRLLFEKTDRSMTRPEVEMILNKNFFQQGDDLKWLNKGASFNSYKSMQSADIYEPGVKTERHFPFGALEIYSNYYTEEVIAPIIGPH
jgi:hypothetical protein